MVTKCILNIWTLTYTKHFDAICFHIQYFVSKNLITQNTTLSSLCRGYDRRPRQAIISRLENATRAFVDGFLRTLKSRAQKSSLIEMDLDIWRYVVEGKGERCSHRGHYLYQKRDFSRFCNLPADSWYYLAATGEGTSCRFPIKAKPILAWTPQKYVVDDGKLVKSPRIPVEKISITFARRPCNQTNLLNL